MGHMGKWVFQDELQLTEINVPRAALQFARTLAYPELNVAAYMARLHDLSEVAFNSIRQHDSVYSQAEQLADFLFGKMGFRGNKGDYNDPRNNFLNDVLERRLGIPISLSVIYVDIANRMGIPAYGISLPGHFIVGFRDNDEEIWLDPYHDGRRLDLTDCVELIYKASGYEGPIEASWFAPAPGREILARMLANLRSSYVSASLWSAAENTIQLLRQTQPTNPEHLRDLGLVYHNQRSISRAAFYLNTYLQVAPDASDAEMIRNGMKHLLDEWVPMN